GVRDAGTGGTGRHGRASGPLGPVDPDRRPRPGDGAGTADGRPAGGDDTRLRGACGHRLAGLAPAGTTVSATDTHFAPGIPARLAPGVTARLATSGVPTDFSSGVAAGVPTRPPPG